MTEAASDGPARHGFGCTAVGPEYQDKRWQHHYYHAPGEAEQQYKERAEPAHERQQENAPPRARHAPERAKVIGRA